MPECSTGTYNTRPLIAEVLVDGGRFAIIRERETYEQILARDALCFVNGRKRHPLPDWF